MKNIISYAAKAKDTFQNREFNAVDSLVLSQLAYLHFDEAVPGISDTGKSISIEGISSEENIYLLLSGVRDRKRNRKLLFALAKSPRFRNVQAAFYVNKTDFEAEKQFSAVTYLLDDGSAYIAYRGTDATFIGWKEDFNMAFITPIPSQEEGVKYLNAVAELIPCRMRIGGHSKGGNIAVYSAIKCHQPIQSRITEVFSHDGPGFRDEIFQSQKYSSMKERIHKTLPQSSVIGMLFQLQESYSVIKSRRVGIMQHDPFSWIVEGNDFYYVQMVRNSAMFMNVTLNNWINSLDNSKRELFIDTLYQVIKATGAATFYDLTGDWQKKAVSMLGATRGIDEETRSFILKTIGSLFVLAVRNLRDSHLANLRI